MVCVFFFHLCSNFFSSVFSLFSCPVSFPLYLCPTSCLSVSLPHRLIVPFSSSPRLRVLYSPCISPRIFSAAEREGEMNYLASAGETNSNYSYSCLTPCCFLAHTSAPRNYTTARFTTSHFSTCLLPQKF